MLRLRPVLAAGLLALTACSTPVTGTPAEAPPAGVELATVLDTLALTEVAPDVVGGRDVAALPGGGFAAVLALLATGPSGGGSVLVTLAEDDGSLELTAARPLPWLVSPSARVYAARDGTVVVAGPATHDSGGGLRIAVLPPGAESPRLVQPHPPVPLPAADRLETALSADGRTLFAALDAVGEDSSRLLAIDLGSGAVLERSSQLEGTSRAFVRALTARPEGGVTAALVRGGPETSGWRSAALLTYDAGLRPTGPPVELTPGRPSIPGGLALTGDGTALVMVIDDLDAAYTPRLVTVRDGVVSGADVGADGTEPPYELLADRGGKLAYAATSTSTDAGPSRVQTFEVASGAMRAEVSPCAEARRFNDLARSPRTGQVLALGHCDDRPTAALLGS